MHGDADKLDMAKMANSVRLALCSLGVRARFDWVPTDANIADTPSRVSQKADMSSVEESAWNPPGVAQRGRVDPNGLPIGVRLTHI